LRHSVDVCTRPEILDYPLGFCNYLHPNVCYSYRSRTRSDTDNSVSVAGSLRCSYVCHSFGLSNVPHQKASNSNR